MQAGAQPIVLILNNGIYGTIRAHQERNYPARVSGTTLREPGLRQRWRDPTASMPNASRRQRTLPPPSGELARPRPGRCWTSRFRPRRLPRGRPFPRCAKSALQLQKSELMTATNSDIRLGADIGGTFTDIALDLRGRDLLDQGADQLCRARTSDPRRHRHRRRATPASRHADIGIVIHGTTLATNALIERRGAKTALVTTEGFPRRHRDADREPLRAVRSEPQIAAAPDPARAPLHA